MRAGVATSNWVPLLVFELLSSVCVLLVFLPYTTAALSADGTLTFGGGLWPSRRVPLSRIRRIVVGALLWQGFVIFQVDGSRRLFMAAPVDGLADLVAESRRRGLELTLDGV